MSPCLSWYAVRTKPRQEERAVENLGSWGVTTLAPRVKGNGKGRESHLFPGYIFARFDSGKMLHDIRFTRGVAYVVSVGGVPAAISDELIQEINARTDEHGVVCIAPALIPGDTVIIRSGLLRNFVGVFERELPGNERVQILLRAVAFSARAEVSRYEVAKVAS